MSHPQYVQIHGEYKNLVDYMLGSFMEELNISPEQFEVACMEGKNLSALSGKDAEQQPSDNHSFSIHKGLFQQIWAANDIRTFIKLMVQKNVEIQLQALDLIERRQASMESSTDQPSQSFDEVSSEDKAEIEKSIEDESEDAVTHHRDGDGEHDDDDDKFKRLNLFFEKEKINSADVSSRQEYLRQQRDKILHIKKQARARKLSEATKERPMSAKAAQKFIDGESIAADEASVQIRKILARKLREEVVDKSSINE